MLNEPCWPYASAEQEPCKLLDHLLIRHPSMTICRAAAWHELSTISDHSIPRRQAPERRSAVCTCILTNP